MLYTKKKERALLEAAKIDWLYDEKAGGDG